MGGILQAIASGGRPVEVPSIQDLQARNMQLQAMAQMGQLRQQQMLESQQAMQLNALKMAEAQRSFQDDQTFRQILADNKGNMGAALTAAAGQISTPSWMGYQANYIKNHKEETEAAKNAGEANQKELDFVAANYAGLKNWDPAQGKYVYDASRLPAALHTIVQAYPKHADEAQNLLGAVQQNPDLLQKVVDGSLAASPTINDSFLKGEKERREQTAAVPALAEAQSKAKGAELDLASKTVPSDPNQWPVWRSKFSANVQQSIPEQWSPEAEQQVRGFGVPSKDYAAFIVQGRKAQQYANMTPEQLDAEADARIPPKGDTAAMNQRLKLELHRAQSERDWNGIDTMLGKASEEMARGELELRKAKLTAGTKIYVAGGEAGARAGATQAASGLTDDDLKRAGEQYAITGEMPPMGKDAVSRGRIMHYGQEYARQNNLSPRDMAVAGAAFKGDVNSLKALQKNRDAVAAFEDTATKNLDQFIALARNLPDTGVPWLNAPIRMLDERLVGNANIAAVNAARQVANNEIAKVTSSPGLSGTLSDSARHEVMSYNPQNATFAQTLAVAKVLRQDMSNRHQAYDAMLNTIKGRMAGGAGGAATNVKTWNPATGRFE